MKFIIGNYYTFKFAGEIIHCKLFSIEKKQIECEYIYWFTDNKYKYPIRKQNICGNLIQ
jgi:hypothetical protein